MALILVTSAGSAGLGQDAVFRTSVDLVTVDATVIDADGRPVDHLLAEDFVLRVDGQRRRIVSAQFVSQQPLGRSQPPVFARHFSSNEHDDAGRLWVMAVDEAHIRRVEGRAAIAAAARFIDSLDPRDRIAVTGLGRVGTIRFTRDRVDLKQRLEALRGQTDPVFLQFKLGLAEAVEVADGGRGRLAELVLRECGRALSTYTSPTRALDETASSGRDACPEQLEQEARAMAQHARTQARISLAALLALVDSLKALSGPKTVVLLSEGMVLDPRLIDLSELAATAKEARVAVYVLHMETPMFEAAEQRPSPTFLRDVQLRADGLARLAGATRGAVFRLVGSDAAPFAQIADELSGYYLVAFEPTARDRDGKLHRVDLQLARGRGLIRARSTFRMPVATPSPRSRQEELVSLLRGSSVSSELPVRVATYAYVADATRLRIVVSTEIGVVEGPVAATLVGYVLTNAAGVIVASGAQASMNGRHAFSTMLPPGPYTLRVAAIDPLDRRGVVERPFAAALDSVGDLQVSDLILAPPPPSPAAALHPVVHEVTGAAVVANLEIYPADAAPEDVRVLFDVVDAETTHASVAATLERAPGLIVARAIVSLSALAAGDYLVHARLLTGGREIKRITRPFAYRP
jgi:VWFA-related protein